MIIHRIKIESCLVPVTKEKRIDRYKLIQNLVDTRFVQGHSQKAIYRIRSLLIVNSSSTQSICREFRKDADNSLRNQWKRMKMIQHF